MTALSRKDTARFRPIIGCKGYKIVNDGRTKRHQWYTIITIAYRSVPLYYSLVNQHEVIVFSMVFETTVHQNLPIK